MGMITTIQRFSLNDGPGIRSTVFFKGCNMRCAWCHNPETLSLERQLHIYPDKCTGCGACVSFDAEKAANGLPPDREQLELKSADSCFSGALEVSGEEMSVEEILKEVLQDRGYYERSGGGVTLSGGEVFMQADFALELLKALKEEGISTAVETNLSFPFKTIEPLLPYIDLMMIDIKMMDEEGHRKWTGVTNALLLGNISRINDMGKPFIIRTPIIPGVNDDAQAVSRIAQFLEMFQNLEYYELLNFNPLGDSKYEGLSIENAFKEARPLSNESIEALGAVAAKYVANVRIG